ncbi:Leiomodin-2 [Terramyces sp. JEL0728]|nr:Leiomodin-2 [Terramyces sp. JEL0728]
MDSKRTLSIFESSLSKPLSRSATDGPMQAASAITTSVFRTNPVLDEVLFGLHAIKNNDPSVTVFDCKHFALTHEQGLALAEAMKANAFVTKLELSNCSIQTAVVVELAKSLMENSTLQYLNLEGNHIGPKGMRELGYLLAYNKTLLELKLSHQKSITRAGTDAEQTFAESMNKNTTLIKLGLQFRNAACRDRVDRAVTRNKEIARKLKWANK